MDEIARINHRVTRVTSGKPNPAIAKRATASVKSFQSRIRMGNRTNSDKKYGSSIKQTKIVIYG